jgi:hypothetical protein
MTNAWLNDSAPKQLFIDIDLQLLMFDKRIKFNKNNKITFSSSYFCYNLLPKQIICEKLSIDKNSVSEMYAEMKNLLEKDNG